MSKHTPGPWRVVEGTVRALRIKITQHWDGLMHPEEIDANNNLIAAAPDMLNALHAITLLSGPTTAQTSRKIAREAIAKAEARP